MNLLTRFLILVHSSNYRPVKRPNDVYRLFVKIREQISCKLLLIGEGPGLEEIKKAAEMEGLLSDLLIVGASPEVDGYVANGDLFLLPSEQESFGLAALESMAYGVPVVASAVGGLPELIEHGKTGYLAPVGDLELMSEYAIKLLKNKELHCLFSKAGINVAAEKFSAEKNRSII